jgi:hypothetical protein
LSNGRALYSRRLEYSLTQQSGTAISQFIRDLIFIITRRYQMLLGQPPVTEENERIILKLQQKLD